MFIWFILIVKNQIYKNSESADFGLFWYQLFVQIHFLGLSSKIDETSNWMFCMDSFFIPKMLDGQNYSKKYFGENFWTLHKPKFFCTKWSFWSKETIFIDFKPKNHILKDKFIFWYQNAKNHDFWLSPKAFAMAVQMQQMLFFGVPRTWKHPKIIKTSIFFHIMTFLGWNLGLGAILIFALFCSETSLFSSEKIGKMSKIHFFINFV